MQKNWTCETAPLHGLHRRTALLSLTGWPACRSGNMGNPGPGARCVQAVLVAGVWWVCGRKKA